MQNETKKCVYVGNCEKQEKKKDTLTTQNAYMWKGKPNAFLLYAGKVTQV